jgi:hypothetical protein
MLELKSQGEETLRHYPGTRQERCVSHLAEHQSQAKRGHRQHRGSSENPPQGAGKLPVPDRRW